jgi:hypothetical protein
MTLNRRALATILAASGAAVFATAVNAQPEDDSALKTSTEALRKAMVAKEKAQLEWLCADQLTYGHSSGKVESKAEFITGAISPKWKWNLLAFEQPTTKVVGGQIGMARVIMTGEYELEGGKVLPIKDGVLMVWQKQANDWKLLARQAYKVS